MRIALLVTISFLASSCAVVAAPGPVENSGNTQFVKALPTLLDDVTCDKSTSDKNVPADVCRIDVNVAIQSNVCTISVSSPVGTKSYHKIVEWVLKTDDTAPYKVRFAKFPTVPSILLTDGTGFQYWKRIGPKRFIAITAQKRSSYYYIFIEWQSTVAGSAWNYCTYDPVINNDTPDDD